MKKRTLSLLLALVLCLGLAAPVLAEEPEFDIQNGVLVAYNGPGGHVTIPSTVKEIGQNAFYATVYNGHTVTGVTIPSSVTTIRSGAFQSLPELTEITIPDSVTYLEYYAFASCSKLETVRLPRHLDYLGSFCFEDCTSLTNVTLPQSVKVMERNVFENTPWIRTQGEFPTLNGTLYAYNGNGGSIVVPNGVTKIACQFEEAFAKQSNITSITIPEGVTEICGSAFMSCVSLKSVTLPSTLEKLGESAFWGCTSLEKVVLPEGLTMLESDTFWGCTALREVTIPAGVTTVGYRVFVRDTIYDSDLKRSVGDPLTGITIHGAPGTAAERLAKGMGYTFVADQPGTAAVAQTGIAAPNTQTATILYYYYDEASEKNVCEEKKVTFYYYALSDGHGITNYVKLRDVAQALNGSMREFNVGWDGPTASITLLDGEDYQSNGTEMIQNFVGDQPYQVSTAQVKYYGLPVILDGITLTDSTGGANNYYKLRDIGRILNFDVSWYPDRGIVIDTWNLYNDVN